MLCLEVGEGGTGWLWDEQCCFQELLLLTSQLGAPHSAFA